MDMTDLDSMRIARAKEPSRKGRGHKEAPGATDRALGRHAERLLPGTRVLPELGLSWAPRCTNSPQASIGSAWGQKCMKPIDVLTSHRGLLTSPGLWRLRERHAEVQVQGQLQSFTKEMSQRNQTVNEAVKTVTENKVDAESPGGGGTAYRLGGGKKQGPGEKRPHTSIPQKARCLT